VEEPLGGVLVGELLATDLEIGAADRFAGGQGYGGEAVAHDGGGYDVVRRGDDLGEVGGLVDPAGAFAVEVIGLAVEDAGAGADDGLFGDSPGDAEAGDEVVEVFFAPADAAIFGPLEGFVEGIVGGHVELGEEAADAQAAHARTVG